jgi:RNA polymerase sigma factor (TIGR02999 family)
MTEFTSILQSAGDGDPEAARRLVALLYAELRALARREMAGERPDHTLQPTALVHEAYMRLVGDGDATFENRAHFFGAAARAIRRILVEHARRRGRQKRGGAGQRVTLDEALVVVPERDDRLLALDEALERLAALDPAKARLVELRYFAGATLQESARMLGVSESTVVRDWRTTRAWLHAALADAPSTDAPSTDAPSGDAPPGEARSGGAQASDSDGEPGDGL